VAGSQKYNRREDERSARNVRRSARGMRVARRKGGRLSAVQPQRERGGVSTHEEREERRVARSQKYNRRPQRGREEREEREEEREGGESGEEERWQALCSTTAERTWGSIDP